MILECQVTAIHLGAMYSDGKERISVRVSPGSGLDFDSMLLVNHDNLKLGDRFMLVMQPCPPQPEPIF